MSIGRSHICVCICTYRRPQLLEILLKKLQLQKTGGLFDWSVVIVDNDDTMSARPVVVKLQQASTSKIDYYAEPKKNIAEVRNTALRHASGDYIAFIDDDEYPSDEWLFNLFRVLKEYKSHAALGPVIPYFDAQPPVWILKGKFCERPTYETGTPMHWSKTRTGNVLIDKHVIDMNNVAFNPDFGTGGEDVVFFKELSQKGAVFVWCNEAPVYENVPVERCTKRYFFRRAFVQGNISSRYDITSVRWEKRLFVFLKSFIAAVIYSTIIPFSCVGGTHTFMKYVIKDIHHLSRLLALCGIMVIKERNL